MKKIKQAKKIYRPTTLALICFVLFAGNITLNAQNTPVYSYNEIQNGYFSQGISNWIPNGWTSSNGRAQVNITTPGNYTLTSNQMDNLCLDVPKQVSFTLRYSNTGGDGTFKVFLGTQEVLRLNTTGSSGRFRNEAFNPAIKTNNKGQLLLNNEDLNQNTNNNIIINISEYIGGTLNTLRFEYVRSGSGSRTIRIDNVSVYELEQLAPPNPTASEVTICPGETYNLDDLLDRTEPIPAGIRREWHNVPENPSAASLVSIPGSDANNLSVETQVGLGIYYLYYYSTCGDGDPVDYNIPCQYSPPAILSVRVFDDYDCDGVNDIDDMDDDNDGILDTYELCQTSPTTVTSRNIDIYVDLDKDANETSWEVISPSGVVVLRGGWDGVNNSTAYTITEDIITANINVTEDGVYTFVLRDRYGDGFWGIDNNKTGNNGNDFNDNQNGIAGYQIKLDGNLIKEFANDQITDSPDFGFLKIERFFISVTDQFTCLNGDPFDDNDLDGTVNYKDPDYCTDNNLGTIVNGVCSGLDFDGDGIINSLDLDTDNDGCPDALEGSDNVRESDISIPGGILGAQNIGNLSKSSNPSDYDDGVPNIVNNGGTADANSQLGQTYAYSRNADYNDCNNVWIGLSGSSDWNTANNWRKNEVPGDFDDIVFATTQNNPAIPVLTENPNGKPSGPALEDLYVPNGATKVGKLINLSDKSLIVEHTKSIFVRDDVIGSETLAKAGKIQIRANGTDANGSFIAPNMCDNGTQKSLFATVLMYARCFKGTTIAWTDNITGSPTFGTPFSASYRWQFFGIPVTNLQASPTFDGSYIREYDETYNGNNTHYYQKWIDLNNSSILAAFKGYEMTQASKRTHTMVGQLQTCDQTLTVTRKAPLVSGATDANRYYGLGQVVFGNSYTASINIDDIEFNPGTTLEADKLIEETVYLYNTGSFTNWGNELGDQTNDGTPTAIVAGQYTSIPKNTSSVTFDGIPSMNGFLIKFKDNVIQSTSTEYDNGNTTYGTDATINIKYQNNGVKANTRPQTAPKAPLAYLLIGLESESTIDKLWLFDQEGTTEGFDNGWDGPKFFGKYAAYIYSETPDGNMQVNTTETLEEKLITFYSNQDTRYTLHLIKKELDHYLNLTLVDLETGTVVPLNEEETTYHFTANNAYTSSKRFKITNKKNTFTSADELMENATIIQIQQIENNINVKNYTKETGDIQIFDVSGRLIVTKKMKVGINSYELDLEQGTYIAVGSTSSKSEKLKFFVK